MYPLKKKRAYDTVAKNDGFRILVDRIWPRGVKKEDAKIDFWLKDVAPSTPLRKWFSHDPEKFAEFKRRYTGELNNDTEKQAAVQEIKDRLHEKTVTLIYGAKDETNNHVNVLIDYIEEKN
ncbi:uncharacterized protein YeaO (DUF488 family) [Scopulibacillus darangshiensis]|uniref:Uncharacterized protein YeaO (DUF488 family) n=1 Tax=Scopulibacillus darangshiensis TaxID=442528 RepID=A0A4R2NP28_9BACL|nr:DUF488 domain-containing protein [Scopulibacillus darangshiensis]TCP23490.1 uncharacterized protein YeaO (DUF488 family) [Scopulibacillus darangshiensis]